MGIVVKYSNTVNTEINEIYSFYVIMQQTIQFKILLQVKKSLYGYMTIANF